MGILDSLKDSFVLSKINKKSNIEIEQLVNLTDNQLKKLMNNREIYLLDLGKISSYDLLKKLIELYKFSKDDYKNVSLLLNRPDEKMYKIKKRFLFPDGEEIWSAMGSVYFCEDCILKIKKISTKEL